MKKNTIIIFLRTAAIIEAAMAVYCVAVIAFQGVIKQMDFVSAEASEYTVYPVFPAVTCLIYAVFMFIALAQVKKPTRDPYKKAMVLGVVFVAVYFFVRILNTLENVVTMDMFSVSGYMSAYYAIKGFMTNVTIIGNPVAFFFLLFALGAYTAVPPDGQNGPQYPDVQPGQQV
ncbi:MAG: hypothetical protein ACOX6J_03700 [Oscillospiraceae bacterium]